MKAVTIIFVAIILSGCCTIPEPEIIVHTETVLPQEITFPDIPKIENIDYSEDETIVYVPADIWVKIAEYMLDVKKAEELYKLFRSE